MARRSWQSSAIGCLTALIVRRDERRATPPPGTRKSRQAVDRRQSSGDEAEELRFANDQTAVFVLFCGYEAHRGAEMGEPAELASDVMQLDEIPLSHHWGS